MKFARDERVISTECAATQTRRGYSSRYLKFRLDQNTYGIPVKNTREIFRVISIAFVPELPAHVKGVINLRGRIIPVIDLRLRFGLPAAPDTPELCIVVATTTLADGSVFHGGLLVDSVDEVTNFLTSDIESAPEFGNHKSSDCISAIAKTKSGIVFLLDVNPIFSNPPLTI